MIFLFYFGISLFIQKDFIEEFPHHIHAWAHTDHYALSKGFINNGFDFFHPETLTSNKQFPSKNHPKQLSRITSSDFPIVQFTAAVIMKTTGIEQPVIYRTLMLLIACLGLLYLFKITYHFTQHSTVSLLLPILLIFSPVYLDYQVGFLPSMAGMSLLFVGFYFYLIFIETRSQKELLKAIIWISLAASIRTPFIIPLLAIIGNQLLICWKEKDGLRHLLIALSGLVFPMIYFSFNQYLRNEFGSIFLGEPLYARNLEELLSNLSEACHNWHNHYFGIVQWIFVLLSVLSIFVLRFLKQGLNRSEKLQIRLFEIYGLGVLLYLILMSRQLVHHDYYALDTFIPMFVLIALVQTSILVRNASISTFFSFVLCALLWISIPQSIDLLNMRRSPGSSEPYTQMFNDYRHLNDMFSQNNIDKDANIIILDDLAPNMPFLLSNAVGINLMNFNHLKINEILNSSYDFIILRDDLFYQDRWNINVELLQQTQVVDYESGIFILQQKLEKGESIYHWLNLDPTQPIKKITGVDLSTNPNGNCSSEFGMTFRDTLIDSHFKLLRFSFELKKQSEIEAFWHIHIHSEDEDLFNEYIPISQQKDKVTREIIIPMDSKKWLISSYIYNPNNNVIEYSDFEVNYY